MKRVNDKKLGLMRNTIRRLDATNLERAWGGSQLIDGYYPVGEVGDPTKKNGEVTAISRDQGAGNGGEDQDATRSG